MDILSSLRPMIFGAVVPEISNSLEALAGEQGAKVAYIMKPHEGNMMLQIIKVGEQGEEVIKAFAFSELPQFLAGNLEKAGELAQTIKAAEDLAKSFGVDFSVKSLLEDIGKDIADANAWTSENMAEGAPVRFLMLNKDVKKLKAGFWAKLGIARPKEVDTKMLIVYVEKETELAYQEIDAFPLVELLNRLQVG